SVTPDTRRRDRRTPSRTAEGRRGLGGPPRADAGRLRRRRADVPAVVGAVDRSVLSPEAMLTEIGGGRQPVRRANWGSAGAMADDRKDGPLGFRRTSSTRAVARASTITSKTSGGMGPEGAVMSIESPTVPSHSPVAIATRAVATGGL